MSKEIAETIVYQLGGMGKLKAMINARNFVCDDEGSLSFRFSGNPKINCIRIKLNGLDLYDITFYKINKIDFSTVHEVTDIYAEDLVNIIEQQIELYLSLGTMGKRA